MARFKPGARRGRRQREEPVKEWNPKTRLGKLVKAGEITSIDELLDNNVRITESEVVDNLLPGLDSFFVNIGQAKGKFGGGQRRHFKRTQKKVREGARNKYTFLAVVGNGNGYIGIGKGCSRESFMARERSLINAKRNIFKIKRGCGDWECGCKTSHSLPFKVEGKAGSVRIIMRPAPRGTGLVIGNDAKKMLKMAGIRDAWAKTHNQTRTRMNYAYAVINALKNTVMIDMPDGYDKHGGVE
ncbi:MAG: 30S ribosomal protein S5 [Candidatus Altiarchaeota archaeon]|nr:30S ribosomal protein S5 [Candidatus Altiarchaeota archaeon]